MKVFVYSSRNVCNTKHENRAEFNTQTGIEPSNSINAFGGKMLCIIHAGAVCDRVFQIVGAPGKTWLPEKGHRSSGKK